MRISILGNCGSGKSTLAQKISEKMNIPHLHIDRLWFEGGGNTLEKGDVKGKEKVHNYIKERTEQFLKTHDTWVSDGWYSRVQPLITEQADTIVFLDIPLWRRIFNHLYRTFTQRDRHPELSIWDDLKFTYQIIRRTFTQGRPMRAFIAEHPEKTIVLRSYKEVDTYLNSI